MLSSEYRFLRRAERPYEYPKLLTLKLISFLFIRHQKLHIELWKQGFISSVAHSSSFFSSGNKERNLLQD